jgi:hypothetical protein
MNPLVDKALQAHQTAENLRHEAITALVDDQKTIADQLKALGYVEGQKVVKKSPAPVNAEKVCPICKEKGHDGRFHRSDKKPATPPAPSTKAPVAPPPK